MILYPQESTAMGYTWLPSQSNRNQCQLGRGNKPTGLRRSRSRDMGRAGGWLSIDLRRVLPFPSQVTILLRKKLVQGTLTTCWWVPSKSDDRSDDIQTYQSRSAEQNCSLLNQRFTTLEGGSFSLISGGWWLWVVNQAYHPEDIHWNSEMFTSVFTLCGWTKRKVQQEHISQIKQWSWLSIRYFCL